jgi:hypothetical protein
MGSKPFDLNIQCINYNSGIPEIPLVFPLQTNYNRLNIGSTPPEKIVPSDS